MKPTELISILPVWLVSIYSRANPTFETRSICELDRVTHWHQLKISPQTQPATNFNWAKIYLCIAPQVCNGPVAHTVSAGPHWDWEQHGLELWPSAPENTSFLSPMLSCFKTREVWLLLVPDLKIAPIFYCVNKISGYLPGNQEVLPSGRCFPSNTGISVSGGITVFSMVNSTFLVNTVFQNWGSADRHPAHMN